MSASAQQKQVTILLGVVAVLLVAVAALIIWQNNRIPPPDMGQVEAERKAEEKAAAEASNVVTATGTEEFDPNTAPVVPDDQTPEEYVKGYYSLCEKGSYKDAYVLLPTAAQVYYGDSGTFAETLGGYGIEKWSVEPQKEAAEQITVVGVQTAQGMDFRYKWTFVPGEDGAWLCASREKADG